MKEACLIIFAKPPIAGQVKTRLIPAIGAEGSRKLYEQLLEHVLGVASRLPQVRVELWWSAPIDEQCRVYCNRYGFTMRQQQGKDLGERMLHALATSLETAECAVLIGSDCPEYDVDYLNEAFHALRQHDAVLGPAADGGYVLIGTKQSDSQLFQNIPWSTDEVLSSTKQRLEVMGWGWKELSTLHDVDEVADFDHFDYLREQYL